MNNPSSIFLFVEASDYSSLVVISMFTNCFCFAYAFTTTWYANLRWVTFIPEWFLAANLLIIFTCKVILVCVSHELSFINHHSLALSLSIPSFHKVSLHCVSNEWPALNVLRMVFLTYDAFGLRVIFCHVRLHCQNVLGIVGKVWFRRDVHFFQHVVPVYIREVRMAFYLWCPTFAT